MNLFALPRAPREFRKTGRVLGGLILAAAIPISAITASAAGPIASSTFAGIEDPLSEGGTWVPLTSLSPGTAQLQKNNGAFPEVAGHAGAHTTAAVPADQYSEIVVGHLGGPGENVGPIVRVQTSGPERDSHYLWWSSVPGDGSSGLYRIDADGSIYKPWLLVATSGAVDGDRLQLIARGPVIYGIKNGVREFIYNPHLASWHYPTGSTGLLAYSGDGVVANAKVASWSTGAAPVLSSATRAATNFLGAEDPLDEKDMWYPLPSYSGFAKRNGVAVGKDTGHNAEGAWGIAPPPVQYSQVTLGSATTGGGGPIVRIDRNAHGQTGWLLLLWADNPTLSGIYKLSSDPTGAPTFPTPEPGQLFPTTPTFAAGDTWRLTADGNTFTVSKNGATQFTWTTTDTSYSSGDVGIEAYTQAFTFSAWEGGAAADTEAPTAPANLTATAADATQINLAWNASTDNVGVTGYQIERCQGAGCTTFAPIATVTGTTYNDTGLANVTAYSYRVRATDAAGNQSAYSNVASASTPDTQAPTAPSGLTAGAASGTQINLGWTASTDNVGVTGYQIERCQGAGCTSFAPIATVTGTTYSNTGLTNATTYRYRVLATDAAGNQSTYSNTASATTPDTQAPTAPANLSAKTVTSGRVDLAWTGSTDNVGVTGYQIERCQGASCSNFTALATATGTAYSDTSVTADNIYRYRVRATDAAGNLSSYSNVATANTDTTAPTAPIALTAVGKSTTQVDLLWTPASDNVAVTGYIIERCQGVACAYVQIATVSGSTTSYSDTNLTPATVYSYRVRATDLAGNRGDYSIPAAATTLALGLGL
jgi:fibronectin type 3 domain-containing protein